MSHLMFRVNFREDIVKCLEQLFPGKRIKCDDVEGLIVGGLLKLGHYEFELITHVDFG